MIREFITPDYAAVLRQTISLDETLPGGFNEAGMSAPRLFISVSLV
jgi:hypothetical protein